MTTKMTANNFADPEREQLHWPLEVSVVTVVTDMCNSIDSACMSALLALFSFLFIITAMISSRLQTCLSMCLPDIEFAPLDAAAAACQ